MQLLLLHRPDNAIRKYLLNTAIKAVASSSGYTVVLEKMWFADFMLQRHFTGCNQYYVCHNYNWHSFAVDSVLCFSGPHELEYAKPCLFVLIFEEIWVSPLMWCRFIKAKWALATCMCETRNCALSGLLVAYYTRGDLTTDGCSIWAIKTIPVTPGMNRMHPKLHAGAVFSSSALFFWREPNRKEFQFRPLLDVCHVYWTWGSYSGRPCLGGKHIFPGISLISAR